MVGNNQVPRAAGNVSILGARPGGVKGKGEIPVPYRKAPGWAVMGHEPSSHRVEGHVEVRTALQIIRSVAAPRLQVVIGQGSVAGLQMKRHHDVAVSDT